jgi:hypothetical protein
MVLRIVDMWNYYPLDNYNIEECPMQTNNLLKTMNATIVTGEYTDRQTGQQKKSYLTIGKLFVYNDGGMSLKLDAMPTGNQNISFYDIKPKNQNNNNQPNQQNQSYNSNGQQQNNQNNQQGYNQGQ